MKINWCRCLPLLFAALLGFLQLEARCQQEQTARRYLEPVLKFADTALEHGRDVYGERQTPLFVDGLHAKTLEPVKWQCRGETWVLCNFASQQPLLRTLDGLTALTGDQKYRQAAEDAARHALENLLAPNGLMYWGGHMAWDLQGEKPVGQGDAHELKGHQPYYRLLHRVDAARTRKLMEAIWAGHILDWPRLDYNRHASTSKKHPAPWKHQFNADIAVPFPAQGGNLSFTNVTPPLLHTGTMLAVLDKHDDALTWTRRLAWRWQQGKHPKTGLCGGQLSYRAHDRAQDALGHVHPTINEAKIVASYHQTCRYHHLPLAQLQAGAALREAGGASAEVGREFIQWASEDLKIYARECYDEKAGHFVAMTIDGERLKWKEAKSDYYVPSSFAPRKPDGPLLWSYAIAYRLTRDEAHWRMARRIARLRELGEIGQSDGKERNLRFDTGSADWCAIYALLELHRATADDALLRLATRIGDNILKMQAKTGLFARPGREYARTGDDAPLALLHLAAALEGKSAALPPPVFDRRFFHCEYHGLLEDRQKKRADTRTYDNLVFFGE